MFRCKQAFVTVDADGNRARFGFGDLVPDDHWAIKGRESLFEPAENAVRKEVEQATAAPGEKRTNRRRKTSDADDS